MFFILMALRTVSYHLRWFNPSLSKNWREIKTKLSFCQTYLLVALNYLLDPGVVT